MPFYMKFIIFVRKTRNGSAPTRFLVAPDKLDIKRHDMNMVFFIYHIYTVNVYINISSTNELNQNQVSPTHESHAPCIITTVVHLFTNQD